MSDLQTHPRPIMLPACLGESRGRHAWVQVAADCRFHYRCPHAKSISGPASDRQSVDVSRALPFVRSESDGR